MAKEELSVIITGDSKNVQAALGKVQKSIKGTGDVVKKQGSLLKSFKKNWLGVTAAIGGMVAAGKAIMTVVKAAAEQYLAMLRAPQAAQGAA